LTSVKNLSEKSLSLGLLLVAIVGIAFATSTSILNNNQLEAQQQQTQTSMPHNAKGHESHQAVQLQNASQGVVYNGTVTFNTSKPVDIIAYDDVTGQQQQQNTSATANVWDVNGNKYAPKTLMKNVTEGTVNFEGAGILTHSTLSQPYTVTFTINAVPIKQ
jgi:lipopolysaccharide export LptBFGC system permease protein LptF